MNQKTMNTDLENQFHAGMLRIYERARDEAHYRPTYYLRMVRNRGGVDAAKQLIHKKPTQGLNVLHQVRRFDLTVEALIWDNPQFHPLFTNEELHIVKDRLIEYGYIK
jgi:hypothetical protein